MDTRLLTGIASMLLPLGGYSVGYSRSASYQRSYLQAAAPVSLYKPSQLPQSASGTKSKVNATPQNLAPVSANDLVLSRGQVIRELVIIDAAVADKSVLLRELKPGVEAVAINSDEDGLQQLTSILESYGDLTAVHVVSHAESGLLLLGNSRIGVNQIQNKPDFFAALNRAVRPGGDILFYGCNLAANEQGEAWLDILSNNTELDVAASNNLTGNPELEADWILEISQGDIESTLPFSEKALRDFRDVLAVTNYNAQGFYDANPGFGDYFQQSSLTSGDGKLVLSAPGGLVSAFGGGSYGMSFAYNSGGGNYYGIPFQIATDGTIAGTFELHNVTLCSDSQSLGDSTPLTVNVTITGYYSNNGSAGSTNVSVTTNACSYGVNINDVDLFDLTGTFGSGKDLARVRFDYNGSAPTDKFFELKSIGVDNIKAPAVADVTPPAFENSTPSVSTITFSGATLNGDLDEDGTIYYVVVADGAAAPSVSQVKLGQDNSGSAALDSGSFATSSTTGNSVISGLSANTAYDIYVVAQDDEGTPNVQAAVTLVNLTTQTGNSDGNLTASGTVTEPVGLDSTVDTLGEAVDVLDFTFTDGGTSDGLAMTISQVVLNVSGTSTDAIRDQITWRLNGNDASNVTGTYSSISDTITFPGLSISVADGTSETYTVNAYYNNNSGLTEDLTVVLSVDGDTDITLASTGTQMAVTSAVTNGAGTTLDVVATQLVFTTQPAGSTSGSALSTQPVVTARDAFGNTDVDFTETVTVTEASAGSLLNNTASAVSGVATFVGLVYTATSDQQSFTLTANDQDGEGSDLPTVNANAVTSDVVATSLSFATQPVPTSINSGQATAFSTVPVVQAVNANSVVDTGYSTDIVLSVTDPNDGTIDGTVDSLTGTGDSDGAGTTVTLTPSSGAATFTGLNLQYTNGGAVDSIALRATSGGLTAVNSSTITAASPPTVTDGNISISGASGVGGAYIIGDTITATWNNTAGGDNNSGITGVTVDFSEFGGGATVSASNSSDTWTATYTLVAGAIESSNLNVSVTANNGAGNNTAADTTNATVDTQVPSGHSVSFDDSAINSAESTATAFTFASAEVSATYSYSITSSGGGSAVTGSGTVSSASQQVSGVNISGLSDGTLTLSVVLTDSKGNAANAVTDTSTLDTVAPTLSSSTPSDGASNVQYNADIVLQMDGAVTANSGNISLFDAADDSLLEAISVASVSISGSTVTINPSVNFTPTKTYYVNVDSGALVDAAGNSYAGINDNSTLNFTVVNNVPTANADSDATDEDNAVAIDVLANDSDSDSSLNPASVTVTNQPSNGSVSVNTGTGVITYTPVADFNGSDSFTYTVDDLFSGTSADATVSVTVNPINDAPVAVADVVNTDEDTPVNISVGSNDTDVDSGDSVDTATISLVTQPTNGSAVVSAGQVVYTPDANYTGSDSFTYQIDDTNGATSNVASVMINVSGVNDAPIAANDSGTTDEDTAVIIDLVSNDTDLEGTIDATSATVVAQPSNGSVTIDTSGQATYTPDANYNGSDSFTYVVEDDQGATSNAATVTVTINSINDAPVAANDTASLLEDTPHNINVLGNDSDVDGTLQSATLEIVGAPVNGTATVSAGIITYTPGTDFSGADSLTYRVQDDQAEFSNTATVTITVQAVNDNPLANNDTATTDEDTPVIISVLDNDSDLDGTLDSSSISIDSAPSSGSVTDNGDGTLTYTPAADSNGSDSFTYSVLDNEAGSSNTATVSITVQPVNDAPLISGSPTTTLLEGAAYNFTPTLLDVDNDSLTVSVTNLPGWLSLDTGTGALTGTPSVGDAGDYSAIVMSVSDATETATLATFSITVVGDNDTDGTEDDLDIDDDNDGMSDSYEQTYGFNPLDPTDAAQDLDGDTISNLQESIDATDPEDANDYIDVTAPVVTAPADLVIDAAALYTSVPLYQLLGLSSDATSDILADGLSDLVYDNVDGAGCCNTTVLGMSNNSKLLAPGVNTITYRAIDNKGNQGMATQIVEVRPLVSVNKDQVSVEGATVQFKIILNGLSPFYPLTIPYVIDSTSTADAADHDLIAGSVVLTSGQTSASVNIALIDDMVTEGNEVLIVRLDDQTTNAEDLANGYDRITPDIYDINSGAKSSHQITITEENVAPDVALQLSQNSINTVLITSGGGLVTVTAIVTDPNPGDSHTLNWSATDSRLMDTDGNATDATFVFDPSGLSAGVYKVKVTATDSGSASDTANLYVQLVSSLPTLDASDSDGDGTDDATEGTADTDDDGIPDYLDNISAVNVLPEQANQTDSYLLECDPGVRCRVGQFALQGNGGGARVEQAELLSQGAANDTAYEYSSGIFDFEIHDLPSLGQSVKVVLPQTSAVPGDAIYRKFIADSWEDFVIDANNEVHSTAGNPGYCPPPGDDSWQTGLTEGDYCVQLTIEDGGPNDADGLVNGSVEDPGGVAAVALSAGNVEQTFPLIRSKGKGSAGSFGVAMISLLIVLVWRRRLKAFKQAALVLVVSLFATALPSQNIQAADWSTIQQRLQDRGYAAVSLYQARGTQSKNDFKQGMADYTVDVSLQKYDTTRTAYQFTLGYRYHTQMAVELGYLDLGEVSVNMSATGTPNNLQNGLDKEYPVSGKGFTLSNRFLWPIQERITVSAEAGLYFWDGKIDLSGTSVNPDLKGGTDFLIGAAAHYKLTERWAISAQIKRVFFDGQEVDLIGFEGKVEF